MIAENERHRFLVTATDELDPILFGKSDPIHLMHDAKPLKHEIRFRHQRFANVKSRNLVPFDQQCRKALLSNYRSSSTTTWATANNNTVVASICNHGSVPGFRPSRFCNRPDFFRSCILSKKVA